MRRLGKTAARLGAVAAVVYGLLLGAREAYEYATTSARFEVRSLIFAPSLHVDDDRVRELLDLEPATNILSLDLEELSERVAAHPWVARAVVTRHLPDTVEVAVEEHVPSLVLLAGHFYLVNQAGEPFKQVQPGERGQLPIVTGIDRKQLIAERDAVQERLAAAVQTLERWRAKKRPRLGEIHLAEDDSVTFYTAESGAQLSFGRGEFDRALQRFDALRAAIGDEADRLAVVHLDASRSLDGSERVVGRFANSSDEARFVARLNPRSEAEAEVAESAAPPKKSSRSPKKSRIPRYE